MMIKQKHIGKVLLQILLFISITFTFAYFMSEAPTTSEVMVVYKKEPSFANAFGFVGKLLFNENAIVSAVESTPSVSTCINSKQGKSCQEYTSNDCAAQCDGDCIPSTRNDVAACKLGTCYDPLEGSCQAGSPQSTCTVHGGQWFGDQFENLPQCREGCCIINGQASFVSEQQCKRQSEVLGLKREFKPEITTELGCYALGKTQEEGACVFEKEFERSCKFVTRTQCGELKGEFYSGYLCSNPSLNTTCLSQQTTGCVPGKDQVFWFDSCGNRENIFSLPKTSSWNNGKVLALNQTCAVGTGSNPVLNAKTCGNCNYILGSMCGKASDTQKASVGDFVCRDLSCVDEKGVRYSHGESWCQYQSAIGVDKTKDRSVDVPGSRNFRKVCANGEIRTEPCADYRNEICIQASTSTSAGAFTSAACRINLAYQCYEYNTKEKKDLCTKNPDCYVKKIEVSGNFKFDYCLPKYKPGFDLGTRGEGAEAICKQASQQCKVIYVKTLFSGWKCKANCECETPKFVEQMNDFCMSLGDCGGQVNYMGTYSENYQVTKSNGGTLVASQSYINGLLNYNKPVAGKSIDAGDPTGFLGFLGIPDGLGTANYKDPTGSIGKAATTVGVLGIGLLAAGAAVGFALPGALAGGFSAAVNVGFSYTSFMSPALGATASAAAGAAVGFAVTALLIKYLGIGAGLPPIVLYSLLVAGAVAGAFIGASLLAPASALGALGPVGWIILVVVIIVILILKLFGIGKKKEITVSFNCKPWQGPLGGKECGKCGSDGLPCSKYACQSLGQTCQLINEETGQAECIDVSPDDVAAPILKFDSSENSSFIFEEFESGIKIKSQASDGCIQETNQPIIVTFDTNEPAQCRMSPEANAAFDAMNDFGSSLFIKNHTLPLVIPDLGSLGLENFDPRARADYSLYLKCRDKSGNVNVKDYAVNFCIKQGPDATPPTITAREPVSEIVQWNATEINASVYTNEPAQCRWDSTDKDYNFMANEMSCANTFEDRTPYGWKCSTILPVSVNASTSYMRCSDQPWLNETNASAQSNTNKQSYMFVAKRSASMLKIDSITPNNQTIRVGTEPASVTLKVTTSGGVDGTARCYFIWNNSTLIDFGQGAWTRTHTQIFQTIYDGTYNIPIQCEDLVGNRADGRAVFTLNLDRESPRVTRVYKQNEILSVITNEPATCVVSTAVPPRGQSGCAFEFSNGSSMSDSGFIHTTEFANTLTYYIKCKDEFNHNPGSSCSVVVKGGMTA